jgi:hypothetical protein
VALTLDDADDGGGGDGRGDVNEQTCHRKAKTSSVQIFNDMATMLAITILQTAPLSSILYTLTDNSRFLYRLAKSLPK